MYVSNILTQTQYSNVDISAETPLKHGFDHLFSIQQKAKLKHVTLQLETKMSLYEIEWALAGNQGLVAIHKARAEAPGLAALCQILGLGYQQITC